MPDNLEDIIARAEAGLRHYIAEEGNRLIRESVDDAVTSRWVTLKERLKDELTPDFEAIVAKWMPRGVEFTIDDGHVHRRRGDGGLIHFDYVLATTYRGAEGAEVTLATGATTRLFSSHTLMLADVKARGSGRWNCFTTKGFYSEDLTFDTSWNQVHIAFYAEPSAAGGLSGPIGNSTSVILGTATAATETVWADDAGGVDLEFHFYRFNTAWDGWSFYSSYTSGYLTYSLFDCFIEGRVSGSISGRFERCYFERDIYSYAGGSDWWSSASFVDCNINNIGIETAIDVQPWTFERCYFRGSPAVSITGASTEVQRWTFDDCTFIGAKVVHVNTTGGWVEGMRFNGCRFMGTPPAGEATIWLQNQAGGVYSDFSFEGGQVYLIHATGPFIRATEGMTVVVHDMMVYRNTGPTDLFAIGIFKDSVFGPFSPPDMAIQVDATSSNNLYIGTGTISGGGVSSVTKVGPHGLLDSSMHPDTLTKSPTLAHTIVGDGTDWTTQKNTSSAAAGPTVTDDAAAGYAVGSRWIDTTNDKEYVCVDSTNGAAVWIETTGGGSGVLDNFTAVVAPTVNEDSGDGYSVGSRWIDTVTNKEYVCVDATVAAAIWVEWSGYGQVITITGLGVGPLNDWSPAGWAGHVGVIRAEATAGTTITGLTGGYRGRTVLFCNSGGTNIDLVNQSGSSTDLNRFEITADLTVVPDQVAYFWYDQDADSGVGRWRVLEVRPRHVIRENHVDMTDRLALDFVDADAGAGLLTDSAVNNRTEVNLSLYALLSGRAGGQTIIGGTLTTQSLTLRGNAADLTTGAVNVLSSLKMGTAGRSILDASDNPRIALSTSSPHVSMTGDVAASGFLRAGVVSPAPASFPSTVTMYGNNIGGVVVPYHSDTIGGQMSMAGGPLGMMLARGLVGSFFSATSGRILDGFLTGHTLTETSPTALTAYQFDTDGVYTRYSTAATAGSVAGIQIGAAGSGPWYGDHNPGYLFKGRFSSTENVRYFIGLSDVALATIGASDWPSPLSGSFHLLRWSAFGRGKNTAAFPTAQTVKTAIASGATTTLDYQGGGDPFAVNDIISVSNSGSWAVERMLVTAIDTVADQLTVTRGYDGSPTMTHNVSASIRRVITLTTNIPTGNAAYAPAITLTGATDYAPAITIADGGDGIDNSQTSIGISAASTVANGDYIIVNASEIMLVTAGAGTTTLTVTRAQGGTSAVAAGEGTSVKLSGMNVSQTSITISAASNVENYDCILIGAEILQVTAGAGTTTLTVVRGRAGTTAAPYYAGASVQQSGTAFTYNHPASSAPYTLEVASGTIILEDTRGGGAFERMTVVGTDTTNRLYWVTRAAGGTSAITHAAGVPIDLAQTTWLQLIQAGANVAATVPTLAPVTTTFFLLNYGLDGKPLESVILPVVWFDDTLTQTGSLGNLSGTRYAETTRMSFVASVCALVATQKNLDIYYVKALQNI